MGECQLDRCGDVPVAVFEFDGEEYPVCPVHAAWAEGLDGLVTYS